MMMLVKVMAGVATMAAVTSSSLMFVQNLPLTRQVAQIIFDRTHIAMPKMTIAPCDNSKHALLQADFDIQVRDPYPMWAGMKANLSPMKTELSFEDESGRTKIGEFEMPELSNHHGHNAVSFDKLNMAMDIDAKKFDALTKPLFANKKAYIVSNFPDITLKFGYEKLGLTITGLKMTDLYTTCEGVERTAEKAISSEVCGKTAKNAYYTMKCVTGKQPLTTSTSWVAEKIADLIVA